MGRLLSAALCLALVASAAPRPAIAGAIEGRKPADWPEVSAALEAGQLEQAHRLGLGLLEASAGGLELEAQRSAFRLGLALVDARRLEDAAAVQVQLFQRAPAIWSAIDASLTLARLGRTDDADGILAAQLAREPRAAALWSHRGLLRLGAGDRPRAELWLARAVRLGSDDATLSLARLHLLDGERDKARAAFRPAVDRPDPHAWGLRGWAATLLPDR
jgi:tetratricopeptide (TPR) repeat protein